MATTTNTRKNGTTETVQDYADATIKDVQDLATATVSHTREVAGAITRSAQDQANRAGEVAVEAWKTWAASVPSFATVDLRQVIGAGFDTAKSMLDAQRHFAERVVDAVTPVSR
jgi:hypothetical protein